VGVVLHGLWHEGLNRGSGNKVVWKGAWGVRGGKPATG
jgi:hypothetical protein